MKREGIERLKHTSAVIALLLGSVAISACETKHEETPATPATPPTMDDWQEKLSDWIGKQVGLYDEDGNIIPREENTEKLSE